MKIIDFKTWLKEYTSNPRERMMRESFGDVGAYRMAVSQTLRDLQEPLWTIYNEESGIKNLPFEKTFKFENGKIWCLFKEKYDLFEKGIIEDNPSSESERILKIMAQKLETNTEDIKKYIKDVNNLQKDYFNKLKKIDGD